MPLKTPCLSCACVHDHSPASFKALCANKSNDSCSYTIKLENHHCKLNVLEYRPRLKLFILHGKEKSLSVWALVLERLPVCCPLCWGRLCCPGDVSLWEIRIPFPRILLSILLYCLTQTQSFEVKLKFLNRCSYIQCHSHLCFRLFHQWKASGHWISNISYTNPWRHLLPVCVMSVVFLSEVKHTQHVDLWVFNICSLSPDAVLTWYWFQTAVCQQPFELRWSDLSGGFPFCKLPSRGASVLQVSLQGRFWWAESDAQREAMESSKLQLCSLWTWICRWRVVVTRSWIVICKSFLRNRRVRSN